MSYIYFNSGGKNIVKGEGGKGEGGCHLEAHMSKKVSCSNDLYITRLQEKRSVYDKHLFQLVNKRIVVEVMVFQCLLESLSAFDRVKINIFCSIRANLEGTVFKSVIP